MSQPLDYSPKQPPRSFRFPPGLGMFSAFIGSDEPAGSQVISWEKVRTALTTWAAQQNENPALKAAAERIRSRKPGDPPPPPLFVPVGTKLPVVEFWQKLDADVVKLDRPKGGKAFKAGTAPDDVMAYSLEFAKVATPVMGIEQHSPMASLIRVPADAFLAGFNMFQRLQRGGRVVRQPAAAPLTPIADVPLPYLRDRAKDPKYFEHWANALFAELDDANAKQLAGYLLQGRARPGDPRVAKSAPADPLNAGLKLVYRWLPRTPDEVQEREREQAALAADPLGPYLWLDDREAVAVIRLLIRESLWVMWPVIDAPARAKLLTPIGTACTLPAEVEPTHCVGYHATARAPSDIRRTGTTRTISWNGAAIGLDQRWHPFNEYNGWSGQALFRRASADNELTTTVSIAQSAVTATDFPLVHGILNAYKDEREKAGQARELPAKDGNYTTFELVNGLPVTEIWVYLVCVADLFDTGALQTKHGTTDKFVSESSESWLKDKYLGHGELAAIEIPRPSHLFGVKYRRYHLGQTREKGMWYHITEIATIRDDLWTDAANWRDGQAPPLLITLLRDQLAKFPMCGTKFVADTAGADARRELARAVTACATIPAALTADLESRIRNIPPGKAHDDALAGLQAIKTAWQHSADQLKQAAKPVTT